MSTFTERRAPPAPKQLAASGPNSLVDLMYDGFYALFLLKNGAAPKSEDSLAERMTAFLGEVDRKARQLDIQSDDIWAAKYAFCAAVDEIILRSRFEVRTAWERRPLQLRMFGDQLAGEHFFERLEELRERGSAHLQALEVFHMCLLLGFEGRFALDGFDKLSYMIARLGEEIARMRGKNRAFAPHAARPDQIANRLRSDTSLLVMSAVFGVAGLAAYLGFASVLGADTDTMLAAHVNAIDAPPALPQFVLTFP